MNFNNSELQDYLTRSVNSIVSKAISSVVSNPKESMFMLNFAISAASASKKRLESEKNGLHIPPFLIASITRKCNLRCEGCFSHANNANAISAQALTAEEWKSVFKQASELGISFIFLAGGEPLLRRDVIKYAAKQSNIIFPVITNGCFIDDEYLKLFDKSRNILPVISLEGNKGSTDQRRGKGVYDIVDQNMTRLNSKNIAFGSSITLTKENIDEVTSDQFLDELSEKGCKLIIYVEYVPVSDDTIHLAPDDDTRAVMDAKLKQLREKNADMIFIAFPGDEKSFGGCIAAGRGFFHINAEGSAEPCPFSPVSDVNVKTHSLKTALSSKLFSSLRESEILANDHKGGCALFGKNDMVKALLSDQSR